MSAKSSESNFSSVIQINTIDDYIAPTQACIKPVKIDKSIGKTKSVKVEEDDVTWARDICLYEAGLEFLEHFAKNIDKCADHLPLFSSICPGWICYAEKNSLTSTSSPSSGYSEFSIIPHVSNVRSPQQIAGRIIKLVGEENCLHVSIMPCFDKKLEASREEFSVPAKSISDHCVPDVDLVLATNELLCFLESLIHESGNIVSFSFAEQAFELGENQLLVLERLYDLFYMKMSKEKASVRFDHFPFLVDEMLPMYRHSGSGSGGYAACIFKMAAERLFSIKLKLDILEDERVLTRQLQNRDIQEIILFNSKEDRSLAQSLLSSLSNRTPYRHLEIEQKALLVFAIANGFRNIQTIVQYLRKTYQSKKCNNLDQMRSRQIRAYYPFDYVEVMACPRGCLNGGGQVKEIITQTSELYTSLPVSEPMSNDLVKNLYAFIKSKDSNLKCLYTTYKTVPKIEIINPSALKW
ncbi:unnamed protein product [Schistosoma turkestanicum]|nr:unnamed protein product [Schistosoma turkestanicum]